MENCIFCKIVKGEVPSFKVWEDNSFLAFLDINPNTEGVTLVVPKKHHESNPVNTPAKVLGDMAAASQKVSKTLNKALGTDRVGIVIEGTGVNHLHTKLYPVHGLGQQFVNEESKEHMFFEKYPGYLTTQLGKQANFKELEKLAQEIQKHVK
jgi:diadenosine tetraphosphate (Ap4A) HIT family hydrolase